MTKFFEIMEGPMGIMDCYFDSGCEQLNACNIRTPINRINDSIRSMFDKMTLADITY
jgi:DNA-binding IscR family transcriptional regulator